MSDDTLIALVALAGRRLPRGGAAALGNAIRSAGSAKKLRQRADSLVTPIQQRFAARIADAWETSTLNAEAVATGVLAAQASAEAERDMQSVDLTWTGPKPPKPAVSRNDEALFEVIDSARERLIVVSYATYKVPELVAKLGEAIERGVIVDLVLEFHGGDPDEPKWWDPVAGLGATIPSGIRVWEWPIDQRPVANGKVGYIHVKCAVADGEQAFVSSANLTIYAMEANMELGVVVRGGDVPRRIAEQFTGLMDDGTLRRKET